MKVIVEEFTPGVWTYDTKTAMAFSEEQYGDQAKHEAFRHALANKHDPIMGLSLEQKDREKRLGINTTPQEDKRKKTNGEYIRSKGKSKFDAPKEKNWDYD